MSDTKVVLGDPAPAQKETPPMNWRNKLSILGMFCILVGVFIGAASKEAAGAAPKFLGIAGGVLIAISIVAAVINAVSSRLISGKGSG